MYEVKAMSLLHKTWIPDQLTPADILSIMKERKEIFVTVREFGIGFDYEYTVDYVRLIPKQYFDHYLESEHDGLYYYIYDYVCIYEDDRPIVVYTEPYEGR